MAAERNVHFYAVLAILCECKSRITFSTNDRSAWDRHRIRCSKSLNCDDAIGNAQQAFLDVLQGPLNRGWNCTLYRCHTTTFDSDQARSASQCSTAIGSLAQRSQSQPRNSIWTRLDRDQKCTVWPILDKACTYKATRQQRPWIRRNQKPAVASIG